MVEEIFQTDPISALGLPPPVSIGRDASVVAGLPASGVIIQAALPDAGQADVWIDFSSPAASVASARAAAAIGAHIVIGTTGMSPADKQAVAAAAHSTAVILSANTSTGVNVLLRLVPSGRATTSRSSRPTTG